MFTPEQKMILEDILKNPRKNVDDLILADYLVGRNDEIGPLSSSDLSLIREEEKRRAQQINSPWLDVHEKLLNTPQAAGKYKKRRQQTKKNKKPRNM
jgi:hypothetical protein